MLELKNLNKFFIRVNHAGEGIRYDEKLK
ncbi:uncharacterized protein METZ01_LOCUS10403 [marine metagenome]|uniref:Uncharacterized protein n=1 Tax=marine metagenome TaxID=408172 RepID=A0A381NTC6_9ZZZZ